MTLAQYYELYETNEAVKLYVDKTAKKHGTTTDTVLKWAIVQNYINEEVRCHNGRH